MMLRLKIRRQLRCGIVRELARETGFYLILCEIRFKIFLLEDALTGTVIFPRR